eukprot:3723949-Rhodomonas_salina.2
MLRCAGRGAEIEQMASKMIGAKLITKQTGAAGRICNKVRSDRRSAALRDVDQTQLRSMRMHSISREVASHRNRRDAQQQTQAREACPTLGLQLKRRPGSAPVRGVRHAQGGTRGETRGHVTQHGTDDRK